MGDDEKSFFLELVHNTQICLTEISGALGPLTMALLRRKVFTNHEKAIKTFFTRSIKPLCLMSANNFYAPNGFIGC